MSFRIHLGAAVAALLATGCASSVVKSETRLSQSVAPGLDLLQRLHEHTVRANTEDRLLSYPGAWKLSAAERQDFITLVCAPHDTVAAAIAAPLDNLSRNQKAMDSVLSDKGSLFDLVIGYVRLPQMPVVGAPATAGACPADVTSRLARELVSDDRVPAAIAATAQTTSSFTTVTAMLPNILGLGDDVARARALREYVKLHRAEMEQSLAAVASPDASGQSAAGRLVDHLRDHHLRQALIRVLELRRNPPSAFVQKAVLATAASEHLHEYQLLQTVRMDGPGGTMPVLQTAYARYLHNIETGETTPIEGVQNLIDTAQRVRGLASLPF